MQWFLSVPDLLMSSANSSLLFLLPLLKLVKTLAVAQGSESPDAPQLFALAARQQ